MNIFLQALGLLTVLPAPARWRPEDEAGRAMAAYPLVGAVVGAVLAVLAWLLIRAAAPSGLGGGLLPAALVLAAWTALTGGLHLDGWADCCDALFVPVTRERRLEIMRDPRLGSFGATGLVILLLIKLAALQGLLNVPAASSGAGLWPLVLAPAVARWAVVPVALWLPPARPEGMAVHFRRGLGFRQLVLATLTVLAVCALGGWRSLLLWPAAALAAFTLGQLALARLGGATGDVYGAIVELVETTVLVVATFVI